MEHELVVLRQLSMARPMEECGAHDAFVIRYNGSYYVVRGVIGYALTALVAARFDIAAARSLYSDAVSAIDTAPHFEDAIRAFAATISAGNQEPRSDRRVWLFRRVVLPAFLTNKLASWCCWLFRPLPCIVALVAASVGFTLLFGGNLGMLVCQRASNSGLAFVLVVLLVVWHEIGHCTASYHAGAPSGGIGVGLYYLLPVFFADVRHSWTVGRRDRLLVDLGGLYFQYVATGLLAWWSASVSSPMGAQAVITSLFLMLHTLNPCIKMDGYWMLADWLGCFNLRERAMQPTRRGDQPGSGILNWYRAAVAGFFAFLIVAALHVLPGNIAVLSAVIQDAPSSGRSGVVAVVHAVFAALNLLLPLLLVGASGLSLLRLLRSWYLSQRTPEG